MLSGLYIRLIGIAVIVAAAAAGYFYVRHLQTKNAELTLQVADLGGKLKDQNAAVVTLQEEGAKRLAAAQADLAAAKKVAAAHTGKATIIYKTVPSVGTATCETDRRSALDLINGTAP